MQMPNRDYDRLEFHEGKEIPYLKGTRIRVEVMYCSDYNVEGRTIKEIAKDRDLPVKDVIQAIEWCTENDGLVTRVLAQERKEAGVKD
ncbi:MAG TPA: hypothetical protein VFE88_00095 [Candidatus Nanoarchaeia archaeon]|nr:hypothetical protein [Candidatus Nanoarchaeia archaeon]